MPVTAVLLDKEVLHLANRARALTKDLNSINLQRIDASDVDVTELSLRPEQHYFDSKVKLSQRLVKIRLSVKKVSAEVRSLVGKSPSTKQVEELRLKLNDADTAINGAKELFQKQSPKVDEIASCFRQTFFIRRFLMDSDIARRVKAESVSLFNEIKAFESRFEAWPQQERELKMKQQRSRVGAAFASGDSKGVAVESSAKTAGTEGGGAGLPSEVQEFEEYLVLHGGRLGGWEPIDHNAFLRMRAKHHGNPSFLSEALPLLPTKNSGEIEAHEEWYLEFLQKEDAKKNAIERWKAQKEASREEERARLEKVERDKKERAEKIASKRKDETEREEFERRKRLMEWKEAREKEVTETQEAKREAERRKQEDEKRKQEELHQRRVLVEEYQRERDLIKAAEREEMERQRQEETELRKQMSSRNAGRIRQREARMISARREKQESAVADEEARRRRIQSARAKVHVERDPARLFQMTAGLRERARAMTAETQNSRGAHGISAVQHRAVPSWRAGLT